MTSFENSLPRTNLTKRITHFPIVEGRPRMLKDFLLEDSNSRSSSGFNSFPRKPLTSNTHALIQKDLKSANIANSGDKNKLRRKEYSKLLQKVSAFQAVINAVKSIPFSSVKPPSILPRSLSRKLSKKSNNVLVTSQGAKENEEITQVKVKDIIRWTSFRDIVEEESTPLDCTTNTTTTTSGSNSASNGSSLCDSDFCITSEYLPSWVHCYDANDQVKTFLPCVGEDPIEPITTTTTFTQVGPKEEKRQRQHSPTSVIDFEFEENEDSSLHFDHSSANVERRKHKLMENIRRFEIMAELEPINLEILMSTDEIISSEKKEDGGPEETNDNCEEEDHDGEINRVEKEAWELLNHLRETSPPGRCKESTINKLLLDFFREELTCKRDKNRDDGQLHFEMLMKEARAWVNGEHGQWMGSWEVEDKRKYYVKDMEKGAKWTIFEDEQEEIALVIGDEILGFLVDELLFESQS